MFRNIFKLSNKIILFNIVIYCCLIHEIVLIFTNTNVHKNIIKKNYEIERVLKNQKIKFKIISKHCELKKSINLFKYVFEYNLTINFKTFKKKQQIFRFENVFFIFFVKRRFRKIIVEKFM